MSTIAGTPPQAVRPRLDHYLLVILGGLVVLLIIAGVSVLLVQPASQLPANSPGGTIQRFYTALDQDDYAGAYALLSDSMSAKPTLQWFTRVNTTQRSNSYRAQSSRIRITNETIKGNTAYVEASITRYESNPGPFGGSNEWTYTENFVLQQEQGSWLITDMPYTYR